jgi:hypothetical protein
LVKLEQATGDMSLQLCREKCQVLPCSASLGRDTVNVISDLCRHAKVAVVNQMQALGCLLSSSDTAVKEWCDSGVKEMDGYFDLLAHPTLPPQIGYTLLRQCAQPRMSYLARVVPSDHLRSAAQAFDDSVVDAFARMHDIGRTVITSDVKQRIHLPLSMGCMGVPSLLSISPAAYSASLLSASTDIQRLPVHPDSHVADVAQQLQSSRTTLQQGGVDVLKVCKVSSDNELVNLLATG